MYHHIKQLMYTVHIGAPDPRFGNMLLEQFGGANGELAAAIEKLHSYDVPELLALPVVEGARNYLDWIAANVEQRAAE